MYTYNEAVTYEPNAGNKVESNMWADGGQSGGKVQVQIQEGGAANAMGGTVPSVNVNGPAPPTVPVYAIDSSVQQFEIPDPIMRRSFARKVFMILLMQHVAMLPIIEVFIISTDEPLPPTVYGSIVLLTFCILAAMYFFSDIRRYAPVNMASFVLITLLVAAAEGVYATQQRTQLALFPMLIAIVQLLAVIAYSKQARYKFSNINAMLLILFVYVICFCVLRIILSEHYMYAVSSASIFHVMYMVYDMQLMMSGHHAYGLQPEEHIFAATNVYADIPNLLWRFFRYIFITPLVKTYHFFMSCCLAEVC